MTGARLLHVNGGWHDDAGTAFASSRHLALAMTRTAADAGATYDAVTSGSP